MKNPENKNFELKNDLENLIDYNNPLNKIIRENEKILNKNSRNSFSNLSEEVWWVNFEELAWLDNLANRIKSQEFLNICSQNLDLKLS